MHQVIKTNEIGMFDRCYVCILNTLTGECIVVIITLVTYNIALSYSFNHIPPAPLLFVRRTREIG